MKKIHQNISQRFEIITTGLLYAQVSVDRRVTDSAGKILVLPVGDVEMSLGVTELLCEAKINDVDMAPTLADAHQEVIWLDIAMNEVARVDVLNERNLIMVGMRGEKSKVCTNHLISK